MDHAAFLVAIRQLCAAADIAAKAGPQDLRFDALQSLAFFRRHDDAGLGRTSSPGSTSNDELFLRTAEAALTMAGRNEFSASLALLEQARSLLHAT
jgi:hypothetical protein